MLGALAMVLMVPHPMWMSIAGVLAAAARRAVRRMAGTRARRGRLSVAVYTPIVATLGYVSRPTAAACCWCIATRARATSTGQVQRPRRKARARRGRARRHAPRDPREAGIECVSMRLRGTVSWPGFGKHGEDWLGFVFVVDAFEGTPFCIQPEGTLEWIALDRMHELPMWDGDRHFLPLVFDADPRPFHGDALPRRPHASWAGRGCSAFRGTRDGPAFVEPSLLGSGGSRSREPSKPRL